jgi:hypothetical protein
MRLLRKNKAICSIGAGPHEELLRLALPGLKRYAKRHGYALVTETHLLEPGRPASWSKVPLVQQLMQEFRNVVWVDCDAVIVDASKDLLDELPREAMLGVVAHKTPEGDSIPNMGIFAVRANEKAQSFFDQVWRRTEFIHHKWWENAAVLALLGYSTQAPVELRRATAFHPLVHHLDERWNSISSMPVENPRIVHFAGQPHEIRLREMARLSRSA